MATFSWSMEADGSQAVTESTKGSVVTDELCLHHFSGGVEQATWRCYCGRVSSHLNRLRRDCDDQRNSVSRVGPALTWIRSGFNGEEPDSHNSGHPLDRIEVVPCVQRAA